VTVANTEVIQKWIDALTSGEYQQGTGMLQSAEGEYCCLGVLCDLYIKETGQGSWVRGMDSVTGDEFVEFASGSDFVHSMPTYEVYQWAGLTELGVEMDQYTNAPTWVEVDNEEKGIRGTYCLTNLNDMQNFTFEQIADTLRKNYLNTEA
jgi:hypothetical protein